MKTLLLALISPAKSKGTREGAIRGLIGVGKEAVRKGLVEGGGAKVVGSECVPGERGPLVDAVIVSSFYCFSPEAGYADILLRMRSMSCSGHRTCLKPPIKKWWHN